MSYVYFHAQRFVYDLIWFPVKLCNFQMQNFTKNQIKYD